MVKKKAKKSKKTPKIEISQRTKIILLISSACVIVIGGAWWAYYSLSTDPLPQLEVATPQKVVDFLGSGRGFARMSVSEREQFLYRAVEQHARGDSRDQFNQALRRMSRGQRQVFLDAVFDVSKVRFLERARDYSRLPKRQRKQFVTSALRDFRRLQRAIGGQSSGSFSGGSSSGGGGTGNAPANRFDNSMAEPFRGDLPSSSDEFTKAIVTRTNPSERSEAQPFIDAVAERYQELKKNPGAMARFEKGL